MTTKVTIEVPQHAEYLVAVSTNSSPLRGNTVTYLKAGERTEIYIHDGLKIVGIEKTPDCIGGLSKSEVFTNPQPHSAMEVSR